MGSGLGSGAPQAEAAILEELFGGVGEACYRRYYQFIVVRLSLLFFFLLLLLLVLYVY